jgi:hypothetical protein
MIRLDLVGLDGLGDPVDSGLPLVILRGVLGGSCNEEGNGIL